MEFEITYRSANRRSVRVELLDRFDIDEASAHAVNSCPSDEYVVQVRDTDYEPADHAFDDVEHSVKA